MNSHRMRFLVGLAAALLAASLVAPAQKNSPKAATPASPATADDYSGMYSFLQEGEFVQLDFGDNGKLTGFVSAFGTLDSDKGAFLDHFIKNGTYEGRKVSFTTAPVHGVWYEVKAQIERGDAKTRAEEGFYVLKGTVTQHTSNEIKQMCGGAVDCVWKKVGEKDYARVRDVKLKSFPQDADEGDKPKK